MALRILPLFVILLALLSVPAVAQDAKPDPKIAGLKKQIEALLQYQADAAQAQGRRFEQKGDVTVEPANGYYAITTPHLTSYSMDGTRTEIGMIAINAVPAEKAGEWKMSVAIPTPINSYATDGSQAMQIDIGSQKMAGVWNESLEQFSKLDSRYDNLKIRDLKKKRQATIETVTFTEDLTQGKNNLWSGPAVGTISNLQMTNQPTGTALTVVKATMNSSIEDYSPAQAKKMRDKIAASSAAGQNPFSMMMDISGSMGDNIASSLSASGIRYTVPQPGQEPLKIEVMTLSSALNASGLQKDNVTGTLKAAFNGLKITPARNVYSEVGPETFSVNLTANNVPLSKLAGGDVKALAAQSNSTLTINEFMVKNSLYDAFINGAFKADATAVKGYTGALKGKISGLDALTAKVQTLAATAPPEQQQKYFGLMAVLGMANGMGKVDSAGAKTYDIQMTADGRTLINGVAFGAPQPQQGQP